MIIQWWCLVGRKLCNKMAFNSLNINPEVILLEYMLASLILAILGALYWFSLCLKNVYLYQNSIRVPSLHIYQWFFLLFWIHFYVYIDHSLPHFKSVCNFFALYWIYYFLFWYQFLNSSYTKHTNPLQNEYPGMSYCVSCLFIWKFFLWLSRSFFHFC